MTRPHFRSFMPGQASRVSRMAANTFWSMSSRQTSSVMSSNLALREVPALLTTMSILPNAFAASS